MKNLVECTSTCTIGVSSLSRFVSKNGKGNIRLCVEHAVDGTLEMKNTKESAYQRQQLQYLTMVERVKDSYVPTVITTLS